MVRDARFAALLTMRTECAERPGQRKRTVTVTDKMQKRYRYERDGAGRARLRSRVQAATDAAADAAARRVRRQVHDRLPQGISRRAGSRTPSSSPKRRDCSLNFFGVDASQPLSVWRKKGWLHPDDPRGWFQWYCRYYMGRRMPDEDRRQIKRWKAIRRHVRQVERNCEPGDLTCRKRQRQALLHWAYDSRKI